MTFDRDLSIKAVADAVKHAGSQSALARLIGTTQATVWKWLNAGLDVTPELVLAIEAATGVSRHDLRPDIYPREAASLADADAAAPRRANLDDLKAAS